MDSKISMVDTLAIEAIYLAGVNTISGVFDSMCGHPLDPVASKNTVSYSLLRLCKKGYLTREHYGKKNDPAQYHLTEKALAFIGEIESYRSKLENEL